MLSTYCMTRRRASSPSSCRLYLWHPRLGLVPLVMDCIRQRCSKPDSLTGVREAPTNLNWHSNLSGAAEVLVLQALGALLVGTLHAPVSALYVRLTLDWSPVVCLLSLAGANEALIRRAKRAAVNYNHRKNTSGVLRRLLLETIPGFKHVLCRLPGQVWSTHPPVPARSGSLLPAASTLATPGAAAWRAKRWSRPSGPRRDRPSRRSTAARAPAQVPCKDPMQRTLAMANVHGRS